MLEAEQGQGAQFPAHAAQHSLPGGGLYLTSCLPRPRQGLLLFLTPNRVVRPGKKRGQDPRPGTRRKAYGSRGGLAQRAPATPRAPIFQLVDWGQGMRGWVGILQANPGGFSEHLLCTQLCSNPARAPLPPR